MIPTVHNESEEILSNNVWFEDDLSREFVSRTFGTVTWFWAGSQQSEAQFFFFQV
jgi:hypothetical protein